MKKELIDRIYSKFKEGKHALREVLEEELPDFQRIDWVRLRDCFEKVSYGYISSHLFAAVKEYNSTLPPALKPLPKEMPEEFNETIRAWALNDIKELKEVWEWLINHYGTPEPKQPLPSVEELRNLIKEHLDNVKCNDDWLTITCKYIIDKFTLPTQKHSWQSVWELRDELLYMQDHGYTLIQIAQHIHKKYSLNPREWWIDCEKFMHKGIAYKKYSHQVYPDGRTFLHSELSRHDLQDCTPYTEPTVIEEAKEKLGEELFNKLIKEIRK